MLTDIGQIKIRINGEECVSVSYWWSLVVQYQNVKSGVYIVSIQVSRSTASRAGRTGEEGEGEECTTSNNIGRCPI